MKKTLLFTLICTFVLCTKISAQVDDVDWEYNETISLGIECQSSKFSNAAFRDKLYLGGNISGVWGIFLHKTPINKKIKFALDIGFSADYAKLREVKIGDNYTSNVIMQALFKDGCEEKIKFNLANLGLRIGPSIVYKFAGKETYINAYAHIIPSASFLISKDNFSTTFVPFIGVGVRSIINDFGIGAEFVQGKGKYKNYGAEILEEMFPDKANMINKEKYDVKTSSFRVYLLFML